MAATAGALGFSGEALASPHALPHATPIEAGVLGIDPPLGVLGGLGSLALVGGIIARTRRGLTIRAHHTSSATLATDTARTLNLVAGDVNEQIVRLPEDGVNFPGFQTLAGVVVSAILKLDKARVASDRGYRAEARRPWPSKSPTVKLATDLLVEDRKARSTENEVLAQVENFHAREARIAETTSLCLISIADVRTARDELLALDWELEAFTDQFANLAAAETAVLELDEDNYVDELADVIEVITPPIAELHQTLSALQSRRSSADVQIDEQPSMLIRSQAAIADAKIRLSVLQAAYHASCSEDLTHDFDASIQNVEAESRQATALRGLKSLAAVEQSEAAITEFGAANRVVLDAVAEVKKREDRLREIQLELPEVIEGLDSQLARVEHFATEPNASDVTDDTWTAVANLGQELAAFKAQEIAANNPAYLQIAAAAKEYGQKIKELGVQAEAEIAEMHKFRIMPPFHHKEAQGLLVRLKELRAEHGNIVADALSADILETKTPDLDMGLDRDGLREQCQAAQALEVSMWAALRSAKQAIRADKERREQERVARDTHMLKIDRDAHIRVWSTARRPK